MGYTRYEYKKRGNIKFLCCVIVIAAASIFCGMNISKLIFNDKSIIQNTSNSTKNLDNLDLQDQKIIALQCGYFSKQENAEVVVNSLGSDFQSFLIEDNGKFRVIAGIYDENETANKVEQLKNKGIEVNKIDLSISESTVEDQKFIEVLDGIFKIVSKLNDNDVESIKTSDYKSWANQLLDNNDSIKLKSLKEYVNNIPEEINKKDSGNNLKAIYGLIKEYKN